MVALGLANGRMKDFYDLWTIPKAMPIDDQALNTAIAATFERRPKPIQTERPSGLSAAMAEQAAAQTRWRAYVDSPELPATDSASSHYAMRALLAPCCNRLTGSEERRGGK